MYGVSEGAPATRLSENKRIRGTNVFCHMYPLWIGGGGNQIGKGARDKNSATCCRLKQEISPWEVAQYVLYGGGVEVFLLCEREQAV